MFSGFMTSLVTNPIDVVRTRIMTELTAPGQQRIYSNPFGALAKVTLSPFLPASLPFGA